MRVASSSSSSSAAPSSRKHKMRKLTREQLLKSLEILGPLTTPLPPDLPPSPPASREPSPAPGSKRKLDGDSEQGNRKKPRTSSAPEDRRPTQPSSSSSSRPLTSAARASQPPDGDVLTTVSRPIGIATPYVPVRRPRRGTRLPYKHYDDIHDKYHSYGRILKWSGEARLWSTYPQGHPDHRPLQDPPHPSSPYHKYGHLIARLELVDSLVCFAYAIWNKDYSKKACFRGSWATIEGFLSFCKREWALEDTDDREKAFLGLVYMIEGFIHARKFQYMAKLIDEENHRLMKRLQAQADAETAREAARVAAEASAASQAAPAMLPSPASITTASSANSTPTTRQSDTPNSSGGNSSATSAQSAAQPQQRPSQQQRPAPVPLPPPHITVPINSYFVAARKSQSGGLLASSYCMEIAHRLLTLPIMSKHYPRTFGRMMYSSLSASDEHEPDIEDEEGELFWPGQCVTGEGLGWVCIMGKAMIKEFSKEYGYKGLDAVIPKATKEDDAPEGTAIVPQPSPRPSSEGDAKKR